MSSRVDPRAICALRFQLWLSIVEWNQCPLRKRAIISTEAHDHLDALFDRAYVFQDGNPTIAFNKDTVQMIHKCRWMSNGCHRYMLHKDYSMKCTKVRKVKPLSSCAAISTGAPRFVLCTQEVFTC